MTEDDARWTKVNRTAQTVAALRLLEQIGQGEHALVRDRCIPALLAADSLMEASFAGVRVPARFGGDAHAIAAWIAEPGTDPDALRLAAHVDRLAIRCAAIDQLIADYVRDAHQLVIVGAGLDTRAFNLAAVSATTIFEADFDHVLAWKAVRLKDFMPLCRRRVEVPGDITAADFPARLRASGFLPALPTIWLVEGVFVYLDSAQIDTLNRNMATLSAVGSRLIGTFMGARSPATFTDGMVTRCDDPAALLDTYGWQTQTRHYADIAHAFGRRFPGNDDFYLAATAPRERSEMHD